MAKRYILKDVKVQVLDVSTIDQKARISGNTSFRLERWDDDETHQVFKTAEAEVSLAALPPDIQSAWEHFMKLMTLYLEGLEKIT